jgi:hypothetical protein
MAKQVEYTVPKEERDLAAKFFTVLDTGLTSHFERDNSISSVFNQVNSDYAHELGEDLTAERKAWDKILKKSIGEDLFTTWQEAKTKYKP